MTRLDRPDSIHTSCRSESSNNSLVVLDKDPTSSQTNWPIQNKLDHHWQRVLLKHPPDTKWDKILANYIIILLCSVYWEFWELKISKNVSILSFQPTPLVAAASATWRLTPMSRKLPHRILIGAPVQRGRVRLTKPRGFRDGQYWVWLVDFQICNLS